jgi:hypothetical protein
MGQVNQPTNLLDRIIDLERQLAEVRKKVGLTSAYISSGGLVIDGGNVLVTDPEGQQSFFTGKLGPNRPDGTPQIATVFRDDVGTARLWLWDPDPLTSGYRQQIVLTDNIGNYIFADDADAGQGIAYPWIPMPMTHTRFLDWPKCTLATYETIWDCRMLKQQPKMRLSFMSAPSDGTTVGDVRVMVGGVQQFNRAVNALAVFVDTVDVTVPGNHLADEVPVSVDARRTGGAGTIGVEMRYACGRAS